MAFKLSPEKLLATASWLALLATAGALAWSGHEIYIRHLKPPAAQEFNFGSVEQTAASERVGLEPVIQAHIFGVVPPKPKPQAEKPKIVEAPKTKLNLLLTGVITSPDPGGGVAMIEIQRGQTSVVRVGANIGKTGAKLEAVHCGSYSYRTPGQAGEAAHRARYPRPGCPGQQLYRRVVFNVLVSNVDDHLRNHGFLWSGQGAGCFRLPMILIRRRWM